MKSLKEALEQAMEKVMDDQHLFNDRSSDISLYEKELEAISAGSVYDKRQNGTVSSGELMP